MMQPRWKSFGQAPGMPRWSGRSGTCWRGGSSSWRVPRTPRRRRGYCAVRMAESVADLEYAVRTHQTFKRAFARWLKVHIALSMALYVLLGLHIWSALHFGLRWFE